MKHSNWWPDWQLRLFRREGATWPPHVHTRVEPSGPVEDAPKRLDCAIIHLADKSVSEHLRTMVRYTSFEVDRYQALGRRPSALRMVLAPPARFAETFILHRGFLDGMRGLVIACLMACYAAMVETQLWERSKRG